MNECVHYTVEIDGEVLHCIHSAGRGRRSIPLLIQAGLPDDLSFDVVVASLPAYRLLDF